MFGALSLLLIWQIEDLQLSLRVLGAAAALVAGLGLAALASVSRHGVTTGVQIGGFGLGAMAILLLTVVRLDLLRAWENTLPPDTPNRFLINVLPDQADAVDAYLAANGIAGSGLHPMVRGRLVALNGRKIDPDAYASPRAQRLARREFNLSWGTEMQPDNRLVAGQWPSGAHPAAGFSVEQGIAESLGIRLGDRLTYRIAGREIDAPVTSLRSVQWDSFNVNFFVIGTPGLLQDQPATYITSFHLPSTKEAVTVELVRRFPNVTLLDVSALMQQVRGVIDRGSAALEYVFAFTLLAGALVLFAGIQAGAESRRAEAAILRTLGANRRQLLGATLVEFAVLGLLAGLLASLGAHAAGYLLADRVFGLEYGFSPRLWLAGIVLPAVGVALAGLAATWSQVTRSPLWSLRRSE